MFPVLQFLLIVCAAVFIAGSVATLILIPFAMRKGLPNLRKKDIAEFAAGSEEIPSIIKTLLLIRKIQTVAWWLVLTLAIVLVGQYIAAS